MWDKLLFLFFFAHLFVVQGAAVRESLRKFDGRVLLQADTELTAQVPGGRILHHLTHRRIAHLQSLRMKRLFHIILCQEPPLRHHYLLPCKLGAATQFNRFQALAMQVPPTYYIHRRLPNHPP